MTKHQFNYHKNKCPAKDVLYNMCRLNNYVCEWGCCPTVDEWEMRKECRVYWDTIKGKMKRKAYNGNTSGNG